MGTHSGSGRDRQSAGLCAVVVRVLATGAAVAASVVTLGIPLAAIHFGAISGTSSSVSGTGSEMAVPATGDVTSARPTASSAPAPSGNVQLADPPAQSDPFLIDARALVPFNRPIVRTMAKDGHPKLNVASAGLKRPPEGFLMAPLEVLVPSSPFGFRVSPLTGSGGDFHLGQDYAAPCGTRVYAADAGVVRAAGWHPWGGGNRVEIDHGNGLITTYNHLEAIAVEAGDSVDVGQVVARVGTTGWSTGCHLHFETILRGKHVSPLNWTLISIRQLDGLGNIAMVSYVARHPASAAAAPRWAIPADPDQSHTVLHGEHELATPPSPDPTAPAEAPEGGPTAHPTATESPTPTAAAPSGTETPAPAPTATATPTPTATSPSGTEMPTPSPTATESPTPTAAAPSGTETPTPTPTATATPTPTPGGAPTGPPPTDSTATQTSLPAAPAPDPMPARPSSPAAAIRAETDATKPTAETPTAEAPTGNGLAMEPVPAEPPAEAGATTPPPAS